MVCYWCCKSLPRQLFGAASLGFIAALILIHPTTHRDSPMMVYWGDQFS
jgi:hypothetical protein